MSIYQCDKTASYDDFKRELRRLESEQPAAATSASEAKLCKPVVAEKKDTYPELTLLQKLNDRIDAVENRTTESAHEERPLYGYRGGFRGRFQSREVWRKTELLHSKRGHMFFSAMKLDIYSITARPSCNTLFAPTVCKNKGHLIKDCLNV